MLRPVEPTPIDWFYVLLDIQRRGYKLPNICGAIGVPRTTVLGWRDHDKRPCHTDGEKLVALWLQVTGKPRDELPRKMELSTLRH